MKIKEAALSTFCTLAIAMSLSAMMVVYLSSQKQNELADVMIEVQELHKMYFLENSTLEDELVDDLKWDLQALI